MTSSDRPPYAGVDLAAAREQLAGVVVGAFELDFMGLDASGNVAVFLGDEGSPPPKSLDGEQTSTALERIARASRRSELGGQTNGGSDGYRTAAMPARAPIFDVPLSTPDAPLHEKPFEGYPHLVIATDDYTGPEVVRRLMVDLGGAEVLVRDRFGAALDALSLFSYEALHGARACAGCRVLDDPKDPRPRAPEALATAGFYVYGFSKVAPTRGARGRAGAWLRIASPSVPAERQDVLEMIRESAPFESFDLRFEDARFIGPFPY